MTQLSRRSFLLQIGHGAAALSAVPWLGRLAENSGRTDLVALGVALRDSSLDEGLRKIVQLHGGGWTREELLGAIYVAGALDVEPSLGGFAHCTMMVPSAMVLADAAEPQEALTAVLYNYWDFKRAQEADRSRANFALPPPPESGLDPAQAGIELEKALGAWDAEGVDRAAVAAAQGNDLDELFEHLWPYGVHDFASIGHKIISTVQAYRTLDRVGFAIAEPVLRSLAMSLHRGRDEPTAIFEANRERAALIDADWSAKPKGPETSRMLLQMLRAVSAEEAPQVVVEMIGDGVDVGSLWDGLRLAAAEINIRNPSLVAVHALTSLNAMEYASRKTKRDETRWLMLLTGASWTVLYRDFLTASSPTLFIDRIEPTEPKEAASILASEFGEETLSHALATVSSAEGTSGFLKHACRHVLRKADGSHYYKYAAAVREEIEKTHPLWAPYLLAASLSHLPREDDTVVYKSWRDGEYAAD